MRESGIKEYKQSPGSVPS